MHPRERILEMGKLYLDRGEPIPLDLLAEADKWGLSLSEFGEPTTTQVEPEGEYSWHKLRKHLS